MPSNECERVNPAVQRREDLQSLRDRLWASWDEVAPRDRPALARELRRINDALAVADPSMSAGQRMADELKASRAARHKAQWGDKGA
jgi:hypothetical protein